MSGSICDQHLCARGHEWCLARFDSRYCDSRGSRGGRSDDCRYFVRSVVVREYNITRNSLEYYEYRYYLKKKRDSNLAVKKLEQLPEEQAETKTNLDPLAGDDIFDDGGFNDEMDAVMKDSNDAQRQLKDKERLIKAREKELADLVRKIKKMDGGSARLRSEGL